MERYERFEPVTVRAAARVVRLGRARLLSEGEVAFYVRELALLDRYDGAPAALWKAARWRSAFGGTRAPSGVRFRSRVRQMDLRPEPRRVLTRVGCEVLGC